MEHYFTNNDNLESEIRAINYEYDTYNFVFYSDLGVFSKDKIDYGSKLLVETFLDYSKNANLRILDVGCGYGFIGITLAKIINANVDMIDINKRAIHLSEKNAKENGVVINTYLSNVYENVKDKYDIIITNPPIRAGKKVILSILKEAKDHLNKDGKLCFVIRKDQGAKSILKELENVYECQILEKSKGFYVIIAK